VTRYQQGLARSEVVQTEEGRLPGRKMLFSCCCASTVCVYVCMCVCVCACVCVCVCVCVC